MEFKRFNKLVVVSVLAAVTIGVFTSYWLNVYGLFGNVKGHSCAVLGTERTAKYLFGFNYISSNFDGVLIGSSISDNWDTSKLQVGRVYNASIMGGNISEEALIIENVLQRRHLKTAIFIIYPYLTQTFGRQSGHMTPDEYWSGLGSVQLLEAYGIKWAMNHHFLKQTADSFGRDTFTAAHPINGPVTARATVLPKFEVNELAFAKYQDLIAMARANGARVIGIVPLVHQASDASLGAAYKAYNRRVAPLFLPTELVIDLNQCPELATMRRDATCFQDGSHYTTEAALEISQVIARRLSVQH